MRLAIKRHASTASVGAAVLWLLSLGSVSVAQTLQPKAPQPTQSGAEAAKPDKPTWMVNCTNIAGGFDCRASQTLVVQNSGQRILTLAVKKAPNVKKPIMMIQGPLGMYLPAGVTLQIGKDAAKVLPVQSCDQAGCVTDYPLTDAEIEAMRGGVDLTVTLQDLQRKPVALKVPGLGFAEAYAKLE